MTSRLFLGKMMKCGRIIQCSRSILEKDRRLCWYQNVSCCGIHTHRWLHQVQQPEQQQQQQQQRKTAPQHRPWPSDALPTEGREPAEGKVKVKKEIRPPGRVKTGTMRLYMNLVAKMENKLEKRYPKAHKIYMLFKIGLQEFFADFKMYFKVARELWTDKKLNEFTRKELENYRKIPLDILRVSPVLIISALPFMNYVVFPIAYLYPRHLLCRHFWTPQQRLDFGQFYVVKQLPHQSHVLAYMEKHTRDISDPTTRGWMKAIIKELKAGGDVKPEQILDVQGAFTQKPFHLDHLARFHRIHMWHLGKSLRLSTRKSPLVSSALLLHHIDLSIHREGMPSLTMEDLQQTCYTRGLDAHSLTRDELEHYLEQWVTVSTQVNEKSISLLLHCPVLIGYNHPANMRHREKKKTIQGKD